MVEKKGEVVWIDGLRFVGQAGSGHSIVFDVPSAESRAGMGPMEAALLAMAGCTAVDIVEIMRKKRQNLTGLRVRISGQQAPEPPNVYTDIAVEYILTGHNLSEAAVKHAIELSETKYCSVGAISRRRHSGRNLEIAPTSCQSLWSPARKWNFRATATKSRRDFADVAAEFYAATG